MHITTVIEVLEFLNVYHQHTDVQCHVRTSFVMLDYNITAKQHVAYIIMSDVQP